MNYKKMPKAFRKRAPRKPAGFQRFFALTCCATCILFGNLAEVTAQPSSSRDEVIQYIRQVLEQPYVENGGFSAFDCSLTSGDKPEHAFTCDAILTSMPDSEIEYLLVPDANLGFRVDMVTQAADQAFEENLPAMDKTCRQFVQQFNQADWTAMYAGFDPNLQKIISQSVVESSLGSMRDLLGLLGEPELELYSYRGSSGRDELQYRIPGEKALAAFRCGLNSAGSNITILAYLVTPHVKSTIYKSNLETEVAVQLSEFYELPISRLEIPLEQLPNMYDVADGLAILDNGERLDIRITRTGRADDFSGKDFTFALYESQH